MATLTAPKNKTSRRKNVSTPLLSEEDLLEKAAVAMQEMASNATALADTAAGLVQKLDAINSRLLNGESHGSR